MQSVSGGDNLHEMSKPIFKEKKNKKNISVYYLLKILPSMPSINIFTLLCSDTLPPTILIANFEQVHFYYLFTWQKRKKTLAEGKQCRTWSDAAFYGSLDSTLFAQACLSEY